MPYLYEFPRPYDPANNMFGNLYEGNNKYPLIVEKRPDPTFSQINLISQGIREIKEKTQDFYTANFLKYDVEFGPHEGEAIFYLTQLAQWYIHYIYEKGDYSEEEKQMVKKIVIAMMSLVPASSFEGSGSDPLSTGRSVIWNQGDEVKKWLRVATDQARSKLLDKKVGEMTGNELLELFQYIGLVK